MKFCIFYEHFVCTMKFLVKINLSHFEKRKMIFFAAQPNKMICTTFENKKLSNIQGWNTGNESIPVGSMPMELQSDCHGWIPLGLICSQNSSPGFTAGRMTVTKSPDKYLYYQNWSTRSKPISIDFYYFFCRLYKNFVLFTSYKQIRKIYWKMYLHY